MVRQGDFLAPAEYRILGACNAINSSTVRSLRFANSTPAPDGALCYVGSVRNYFQLDRESVLADDGITTIRATGGGCWRRLPSDWAGPSPWLDQTTWYIDANNGSDEGVGNTAAEALATHAELMRRLGKDPLITQAYTINILSDLSEAICIRARFFGADAVLYYVGAAASTILTGTVNAWTESAVGVEGAMTDVAGTDFSAAGVVGKRIRLTSGAQVGRCTWISDWGTAGVNTARVGKLCYMATPHYGFNTGGAPAGGDSFVVEDLYTLSNVDLDVQVLAASAADLSTRASVLFQDLFIAGCTTSYAYEATQGAPTFLWCGLGGGSPIPNAGLAGGAAQLVGCCFTDDGGALGVTQMLGMNLYIQAHAGGIPWFEDCAIYRIFGASYFDQGAVMFERGCRSYSAAEFGVYDSTGHGIEIDFTSSVRLDDNWGGNINSRGVSCWGRCVYATGHEPTISGTAGDASVGGTARTWAQIPYVEANKLAMIVTG